MVFSSLNQSVKIRAAGFYPEISSHPYPDIRFSILNRQPPKSGADPKIFFQFFAPLRMTVAGK
jgi:hypothetical protein